MARRQRCGVQLPPSGKMTRALPRVQAGREAPDLVDVVPGSATLPACAARRRNALGTPVGQDVHARVELQRGLHDDARAPLADAEQVVDEQQRVAGAGVAAEHDERAVAARARCPAGRPPSRSARTSRPATR